MYFKKNINCFRLILNIKMIVLNKRKRTILGLPAFENNKTGRISLQGPELLMFRLHLRPIEFFLIE